MSIKPYKALGAAIFLGFCFFSPATAKINPANNHLDEAAQTQINEISDYLNAIDTIKGEFLQTNPDGSAVEGDFYMRRPGRMRFEYEDPPMTLLSDGTWAIINDRAIETAERYPLRETPLFLLLKKNVDLLKDAEITKVEHGNGLVAITAEESTGVAIGSLTLIFNSPDLELKYWVVTDVNGSTVVMLKNLERGVELDPALFFADEGDVFGDDVFD